MRNFMQTAGDFALILDARVTCIFGRNLGSNSRSIRANLVELLLREKVFPSALSLPCLPPHETTSYEFGAQPRGNFPDCVVNRVTARLKGFHGVTGRSAAGNPEARLHRSETSSNVLLYLITKERLFTWVRVYGWSLCIRIRGSYLSH